MKRPVLCSLALAACQPDPGPTGSTIVEPTILAIVAEPAEAPPYQFTRWRALVASAAGTVAAAPIEWAFCSAPKPPSEDNAVSADCLGDGDAVVRLGAGPGASAPIPATACSTFGPDVPPQPAGMPPLRPRDPDVTGGYYQPLRARLGGQTTFGLSRITCNLAGATAAVAAEYRRRYQPNANPHLTGLSVFAGDQAVDVARIPRGGPLRLLAAWSPGSAETYPALDPGTGALVDRREVLRASWFATAGRFDDDHTGAADSAPAATENGWTPPPGGEVHLWIVLRDDRGGVDHLSLDLR